MGYRMVTIIKDTKKALLICFFQLFVIIICLGGYFLTNFIPFLLVMPIIEFLGVFLISNKFNSIKISILCYSWVITMIIFSILAVYMYIKGSELGLFLIVCIHLYGFTLPSVFCIIFILLNSILKRRKRRENQKERTGD